MMSTVTSARAGFLILCGIAPFSGDAFPAQADATLTCEQVYAVAQSSVRFRDQGLALAQVLAVLDGNDIRSKFGGAQIALLRDAVSLAYLGNATPEEIALECVRARGRN
jgi:hypothetical protein